MMTARPLAFSATFACASACALTGCPSVTTTTGYTPITGIVIRSSALVAGYGCGTGLDQVYRYVAVVSYATADGGEGTPLVANVFECFTDGVFANLPASDSGSQAFVVTILAYNFASFPSYLACPPSGGPCAAQDAGALLGSAPEPTWRTECTATQQQGIPVLAVCNPFEPGNADEDAAGDAVADVAGDAIAEAKAPGDTAVDSIADAAAGAADPRPDASSDAPDAPASD